MTGGVPYGTPLGSGLDPRPSGVRWLTVVIAVLLIGTALVVLLVLFFPTVWGLPVPSYSNGYLPFGGLLFVLIVVFFVVRVAFWGVRAGRYGTYRRPYAPGRYGPNRPAMIARLRYARGEITKEQYDRIMEDLNRPLPPPP